MVGGRRVGKHTKTYIIFERMDGEGGKGREGRGKGERKSEKKAERRKRREEGGEKTTGAAE